MSKGKTPVVLIPGFTGSRLTTRRGSSPDYPLWLSLSAMHTAPGTEASPPPADGPIRPTRWWLEEMSLAADGVTPRSSPDSNGPVRGLAAISVLDPSPGRAEKTRYFWNLIQTLHDGGYTDQNLRAAPYDWRAPPCGLQQREDYFGRLRLTIEDLVAAAPGRTPATIVAHSLGNRITQYFLEYLRADESAGQAWIDRHIRRYIAVSALWLGVPKSIREALTGADGLGLTRIAGLKEVYQSYGALPWMLPVTREQFVYLNTKHFAFLRDDQQPLTIDSALERGAALTFRYMREFFLEDRHYTRTGEPLGSLAVRPPPVRHLDVLHATGQDTEIGAYYLPHGDGLHLDTAAESADPQFRVADGIRYETASRTVQRIDGTTNSGDSFLPYGSLRYFTIWQGECRHAAIKGRAFPGRTHYDILQDEDFLATVMELLEQPV